MGIIELSKSISDHKKRSGNLAQMHKGAAIMAEVSLLTPKDIRLTTFEYQIKPGNNAPASLILQGLVKHVNKQALDGYIDRLSASPLVKTVTLTHVRDVELEGKKEQYFESSLELK